MSNERPTIHLTWSMIITLCSSFIFPALGLLFTGIIFGTRLIDKVENISNRVDVISTRQDRADEKLNHINSKVDTIERRQAIYQATHR